MRASSFGLTLLIATQAWCWAAYSCAQPPQLPPGRAGEKSAGESTETIKRVEPDILYVRDAKGELVPLLNHTLEELEPLLEAHGGAALPRPGAFRIERMSANGEAAKEHATLTIQFTIQASDKTWIKVPLRLGSLALSQEAKHEGEGEQFLEYDETSHEYVSWFRGETQKPHVLTLQGLAPLERVGAQTRLKLSSPRAVHSELNLKAPLPQAVGEVSPGAVLATTQSENGSTAFKAIGLTSDFVLSWREKTEPVIEAPAALDVTGRILVQVNQQTVQTRATLMVKAFGREFDRFRVRLPQGAVLVQEEHEAYAVNSVEDAPSPALPDDEPQWVEVRREKRATEPFEVQLTTRRVHEEAAAGKPIELNGFDVQGASRQWGSIAVAADHNWQVSFGKRTGVRQVEDLPENARPDDARAGDWVASFEYYRQPYSLPMYVSPRETVVSVDPTYKVYVRAHRLELDASLAYRIGGAKAFSLEIDVPGWEIDVTSIGPADFIDASRIVAKPGVPLVIPLRQPAFGDLRLTFRAQSDLPADAKAIDFQLPRPIVNTLGLANLAVIAADNVELTPREPALEGLARQAAGAQLDLPPHQQEALFYRGDLTDARFSADFRIHPREISVGVTNRVRIGESESHVEQLFAYRIAYEPATTLAFDLPRELADESQFEIRLGDKTLSWEPVLDREAGPEDAKTASGMVRIRVKLPEPRMGACDLKLAYAWSGKPLIRQASVVVKLPLAMPAEGECTENFVEAVVEPGINAELLGEEWTPRPGDDSSRVADDLTLRFSSPEPRPDITFSSTLADRPRDGTLVVERAWIRTELTRRQRIDLAVYRFDSRDSRFSLVLPPGSADVEFKLDGNTLDGKTVVLSHGQQPDEHVLSWQKGGSDSGAHVLEVRYTVADRRSVQGRLLLDLPKLGPGISSRRTYWQLILPRDEYLVGNPAGMTPETFWDWRNFHWERRPLLDQRFLESWVFDPAYLASREALPPVSTANEYLFSCVETAGPAEIRLAERSTLVLIGSGLVLFIGLLLIYAPALRHPALLFVAAVCGLAAALIYPEMTLLWLQAAAAGAVLTALAAFMERNVSRRRRRESLMRGGSSSIVSRNATRSPLRSGPAAPVSTETAALAVELSAPESRP